MSQTENKVQDYISKCKLNAVFSPGLPKLNSQDDFVKLLIFPLKTVALKLGRNMEKN